MTGSFASQGVFLLTMPILSRIYDPEDFGRYAIFLGYHVIASTLLCLKLDLAIMLPKSNKEASNISTAMLTIAAALSAILVVLLILFFAFIQPYGLPRNVLILPATSLSAVLYATCQQWSARKNDFRLMAMTNVVNAIANSTAAILFSQIPQLKELGMPLALCAGLLTGFLFYSVKSKDYRTNIDQSSINLEKIRSTVRDYLRYPLHVLPLTLIQNTTTFAPPFTLSYFFSASDVGHLSVASRLLSIPLAFIGSSFAESFRAEFIMKLHENENTRKFFRKSAVLLLLAAAPVFGVFYLMAPLAIEFALGPKYATTGEIVKILSLGSFGLFVATPLSSALISLGKTKAALLVQIFSSALPVATLVVGGVYWSFSSTLTAWSVLTLFACFFSIIWTYRLCPRWQAASGKA